MEITALFACACGFTQKVHVRVDERVVSIPHRCRLVKAA